MATLVTMPAVITGSTEAVLSVWLRQPGDEIAPGDALAEIETEKATVEMEAEASGVLRRTLVAPGDSVEVGIPIAVLGTAADDDASIEALLAAAGLTQAARADGDSSGAPVPTAPAGPGTDPTGQPATEAAGTTARLFASPLARRLAKDARIDIAALTGTGPGGRIVRADVEKARSAQPAQVTEAAEPSLATQTAPAAPSEATATVGPAPVQAPGELPEGATSVPLTRMRQAIARRLTESKTTVPHFYLTADVCMDALLDLRAQVNAAMQAMGRKITVNDLVVRAIALALQDVPAANVGWAGDSITQYSGSDVSVAVATEGGLLTPVVRSAHALSIAELSAAVADYAQRAQAGKVRPDELAGGSFSVSNLGMYGVREFSAILNPPQAGILAVGAAEQRPVVVDGQLAVATVMTVTLSADHRAIDGAVAAQLLAAFKGRLENPLTVLV